jgi:hypothetical protein
MDTRQGGLPGSRPNGSRGDDDHPNIAKVKLTPARQTAAGRIVMELVKGADHGDRKHLLICERFSYSYRSVKRFNTPIERHHSLRYC